MISKQKRNLINELSFYILEEVKKINENNFLTPKTRKENIRKEYNMLNKAKDFTNKQIKELIKDLKYQLPF
jgi:hypothetical protein|tara:strand:- start:358 stop:570 length:213 start_codon:yes stop_codon:yes gene_type:complete